MTSYNDHLTADARLVILKELAKQVDGRLNESILTTILDTYGYRRNRDWVRTQMRALADLGAVSLQEAGSVLIAGITRTGMDHVERRLIIEGVARPSPGA